MLNNDHLNKFEIKKRLLEKLNTISSNEAEQESQIMISYSANCLLYTSPSPRD